MAFKKVRNKINNQKKSEEYRYKVERIETNINSPEKTWQTAKEFMGWKQQGAPEQLQVNGNLVTKPQTIATYMNQYFLEKVNNIRNNLQKSECDISICQNIMSGKKCQLSLKYVSLRKNTQAIEKS